MYKSMYERAFVTANHILDVKFYYDIYIKYCDTYFGVVGI